MTVESQDRPLGEPAALEATRLIPRAPVGIASSVPDSVPAPVPERDGAPDLSSPQLYLDREFIWLAFE